MRQNSALAHIALYPQINHEGDSTLEAWARGIRVLVHGVTAETRTAAKAEEFAFMIHNIVAAVVQTESLVSVGGEIGHEASEHSCISNFSALPASNWNDHW